MRNFWIYFSLTVIWATSLIAQPEITTPIQAARTMAEFNTMLRDMDLNADTQSGYSITKPEYALLLAAWNNLSLADRKDLMDSNDGWKDFALMLLFDLLTDTPWEVHFEKAVQYKAKGLSLTASRYKNYITLKRARKTLLDLLHNGPSMITDGRLVLVEQIKVQAKERAGKKALKRLEKWEELINNHQDHSNERKLKAVNDFFNCQITETPDGGTAQGYDYWQSPIETIVRGKGDCDDFAIAQYVSLRLLGIPAMQLRVGVVEHSKWGGHGVLFFYPPGENDPWVLDNLNSARMGMALGHIRRLSSRVNFNEIKPLWGLNENILTEFQENLNETVTLNDPCAAFPAFAIALTNSQRLLPQNEELSVAQSSTIRETWRSIK